MSERVVSLLPSATEILFAVGAGADVVAVTHECDFPAAATALPAITASAIDHEGRSCAEIDRHIRAAVHAGSSIYRLDEARLAALDPTLIVTQELCEVCAVAYREVAQAVRRLPSEVPVLSLEPAGLDDVLATMLTVGAATGHDAEAAAAVRALRARLDTLRAMDAPARPPRVACVEWTDPLMVAGHWVPEMVARAGGEDVLGAAGAPSRWVDWAEIVAAQPDVLVLMPCGFGLEATVERAGDVLGLAGFGELPCARAGRVVAVDGSSYFNRPGPRVVDGAELLAAVFRARPGEELPLGAAWLAS